MATFKNGILGGFNGKVGTVVGYSWKGKSVMRSIAQNIHNPRTEAQQSARMRFTLLIKAITQLYPIVAWGFKSKAQGVTESNVAFSLNYAQVFTGNYPDISLDLSKLQLSSGPLPPASNPNATVDTGQRTVNFTWDDNSGELGGSGTDTCMIALYNPNLNQAVVNEEGAARSAETFSLVYPSSWIGSNFAVYMVWRDASGSLVSESSFLGSHEA